jgi:hypothetical protein
MLDVFRSKDITLAVPIQDCLKPYGSLQGSAGGGDRADACAVCRETRTDQVVNGLEYFVTQRLEHNSLTCSTILLNIKDCAMTSPSPLLANSSLLTRPHLQPAKAAPLVSPITIVLYISKRWVPVPFTLCRK